MFDHARFFASVRTRLFAGRLRASQVAGIENILDAWRARGLSDRRWLAYMLATTFHETARTMQPIAEFGRGRERRYGRPDPATGKAYYGRGLVQLTWKTNCARAGRALGVDLVADPDRAMRPEIAVKILFDGMINGWFAATRDGQRCTLARYFNAANDDPHNARRIINGTDRAALIARYHHIFLEALEPARSMPPDNLRSAKPAKSPRTFGRISTWLRGLKTGIETVFKS